jgi:hypothetical protein
MTPIARALAVVDLSISQNSQKIPLGEFLQNFFTNIIVIGLPSLLKTTLRSLL